MDKENLKKITALLVHVAKVDEIYSESIQKLSANTKVKKAFKYIIDIEEKTMKNLIELTEIEAPPFKEEKRAKEFAERLKLAGIENVWIDSIGNVIGLLKGTVGNKNIAIDALSLIHI